MLPAALRTARQIAQNLAMALPPVRRLATRVHERHLTRESGWAEATWQWLSGSVSVDGRDILEVGPGYAPELLRRAHASGAGRRAAVDILPYLPESERHGIDYRLYDGVHLPFDGASFDLAWAVDVFQHFRQPRHTLAEIARVLRPGGELVARIDLRDHQHLDEESGWLTCLRYPEWQWKLMTWNRGSYVNRLRLSDWLRLFDQCGLDVTSVERSESDLLRQQARDDSALARYAPDDLPVYRVDLVARTR